MSAEIKFNFPKGMLKNRNTRESIKNAANFVRDLWLSRVPNKAGGYAKGLQQPGSVKVEDGKITVTNFCPYAGYVENGFKSYNIGMRILANGKGVKVSKDGYRYKIVRIPERSSKSPDLKDKSKQVINAFRNTIPKQLSSAWGHKTYERPKSLQAHLSKKKQEKGNTASKLLVISEKTIKKDPTKWQMPAREGQKIAKKVFEDAKAYIAQAIKQAHAAEVQRQVTRGNSKPSWARPAKQRFIFKPKVGARKVG
ncbi:MAG: hypothetical protein ACXVCY_04180 [Pseudobdellovibrionaceae bacterium]